jgi:hypothetical protein
LYDDVNQKIAEAEAAQLRKKSEPPKPKPVSDQAKLDDEKAKKEAIEVAKKEAAEKKKADEEKKQLESLANAGKDSKGGKTEEGGTPAATATADASKGGSKDPKDKDKAAADAEAEEKKAEAAANAAILKAKEPYPAVTDKSPELQVIKLGYAGTKYVYAYIQLYNKDDNGRTINKVAAWFKDKDNQTLIPDTACYTFPFEGFRPTAKDMIGDQGTDALTLGSHKIDGQAARRFVVIGEGDRAKDCKHMDVKVIYDGGTNPWVHFPDK